MKESRCFLEEPTGRDSNTSSCTMFMAAWVTPAKSGDNPSVHWQMMGQQKMVREYNGISFSLKKERNSDTCYNMDEPRRHYIE